MTNMTYLLIDVWCATAGRPDEMVCCGPDRPHSPVPVYPARTRASRDASWTTPDPAICRAACARALATEDTRELEEGHVAGAAKDRSLMQLEDLPPASARSEHQVAQRLLRHLERMP
jgi:hypothetical protein